MNRKNLIAFILIAVIALVAAYVPLPLAAPGRIVIALALISAICWTLEPIPVELTALCLLFALPLSGVATFQSTFAAFGRPAVWLVFAGMVISQLITDTRLGDLLSSLIVRRLKHPFIFIIELSLLGVLLAILIPSGVVRVLIILPVLVSLIEALKAERNSSLSAAIILSTVCATYYGGTGILTASVPNLVIMGVLESSGHPVFWAQWAGHMFPVIGLLRVILGALLIIVLFRPTIPGIKDFRPGPIAIGNREIRALLLLILGVCAWATDTIHHVHPAMIGLGMTILCIVPRIGPLTTDSLTRVNYPILIYIGSVFALGDAVITSGAGKVLATTLTSWLQLSDSTVFQKLSAITYLVTPFNFLVDTAVVGGVLTPPLLELGAAAGLSPLQVGLSVAIGTGMVFMPYQGAPFMVAYSYGYVSMRQFAITMLLICAVNLVILIPLNLIYWDWIGLF
ncbi:MAG: SLC13 family permease [Candidatus Latescibacterota bacterium]|nr:SLC13 family permease [Candidatus Latescibacterota bacterium]